MAVQGVPTTDYQESREKLIRCTTKWKTTNGVDDHKPRPVLMWGGVNCMLMSLTGLTGCYFVVMTAQLTNRNPAKLT